MHIRAIIRRLRPASFWSSRSLLLSRVMSKRHHPQRYGCYSIPTPQAHNHHASSHLLHFFSTDALSFSRPCQTLIDLSRVRLGRPIHIFLSRCSYTLAPEQLAKHFVGFFTSVHPIHACVVTHHNFPAHTYTSFSDDPYTVLTLVIVSHFTSSLVLVLRSHLPPFVVLSFPLFFGSLTCQIRKRACG